jgi:hypothetical protein
MARASAQEFLTASQRWTDLPSAHASTDGAADLGIHPEVVRWLIAYAQAAAADRDATVAELLHVSSPPV